MCTLDTAIRLFGPLEPVELVEKLQSEKATDELNKVNLFWLN